MKYSFIKKIFFYTFILFFILTPYTRADKIISDAAYTGPIYNIFFHPLIAYPKLAFDSKNTHLEYMDSWFITTKEFTKTIEEIYKKGFVLFSPKDIFAEAKDKEGRITIVRKNIFLPHGKKPLILSLDDYNFYKNMKLYGTIHKFWVDSQGRLSTVTNINGQDVIRYDQEVPQILEEFIKRHPDFSFNKARGIFSLTGYNGILGYDTHNPYGTNYQFQLNEVKRVIHKLKEMGWEFGSHSYFHRSLNQQSKSAFEKSEKRWIKEVGSLVGTSSYYFFPFGDAWEKDSDRMHFLQSLGYKYFFGVSSLPELSNYSGSILMERYPLDGLAIRNQYKYINIFITPSKVFDSARIRKKT